MPGGRVLVLDLREHHETWVRERLGDRWLGFTDERLTGLLEGAGFTDIEVSVGAVVSSPDVLSTTIFKPTRYSRVGVIAFDSVGRLRQLICTFKPESGDNRLAKPDGTHTRLFT